MSRRTWTWLITAVIVTLHYPYINEAIAFVPKEQTGASAQIDQIVSAAVTEQITSSAGQHMDDMPPSEIWAQFPRSWL